MNIPFKFENNAIVKDLVGDLGVGQVLNAYVQWDGDLAQTVYSVDFAYRDGEDSDPDEEMVFDRYAHELEPSDLGETKKYIVERNYTLHTYYTDYFEVEAVDKEAAQELVEDTHYDMEPYKTKDWDCEEGDDVDYEVHEET